LEERLLPSTVVGLLEGEKYSAPYHTLKPQAMMSTAQTMPPSQAEKGREDSAGQDAMDAGHCGDSGGVLSA
jgi:hypothetical protein